MKLFVLHFHEYVFYISINKSRKYKEANIEGDGVSGKSSTSKFLPLVSLGTYWIFSLFNMYLP